MELFFKKCIFNNIFKGIIEMINAKYHVAGFFFVMSFFSVNLISFEPQGASFIKDRMNNKIEEYINMPTREVVSRAGTDRDIAKMFKEEILTDPIDGQEVTEEYKNKKCMQQMRIILRKGECSPEKSELLKFKEDKSVAFDQKEKVIDAECTRADSDKIVMGAVTIVSALAALAVISVADQEQGRGVGYLGCFAVIAGSAACYKNSQEAAQLNIHKARIHTMKTEWENSFNEQ